MTRQEIRELDFHKKVVAKDLDALGKDKCFHFNKEALALRGIPDRIGCYCGLFFAFEIKKNLAETKAKTGRIVLQKYILGLINRVGGFGRITCPQTWEQDLKDMIEFSKIRGSNNP